MKELRIRILRSAYKNDNRCADLRTQDNVTLQLMPCNNNAKSRDFKSL